MSKDPKIVPLQSARRSAMPTNERRIRTPDTTEAASTPLRSRADVLAAEVDRLVEELNATRAQLAELAARADTDPLTELLNRRGFDRELTRAIAYVKRYEARAALLLIEFDGLKPINLRHGHPAGDRALQAVAQVLTERVRASDIVSRIDGNVFAVLLWNLDETSAHAKALALESEIMRQRTAWGTTHLSLDVVAGATMLGPFDGIGAVIERAGAAVGERRTTRGTPLR